MKRSVIGNSDTSTVYIGKSYERVTTGSSTIHKNFIYAGSKVIAIKENSGIHYMHGDTQGNIIAISKDNGTVINRRSYTPFGEIRAMATKEGIANALNQTNITNRGYTGHEHVEGTDGLIHMNGRVYDATIGRFMSADPLIQAPTDTQSYNRYSYVRNNPVNLIDPSGYNWASRLWKKIKPFVAIAAAITIGYLTMGTGSALIGGAWGSFFGGTATLTTTMVSGALAGAASGAIMTGSVSGTLKGALWGGVTAGVAFGVAEMTASAFNISRETAHSASFLKGGNSKAALFKAVSHGLSRTAISKLRYNTTKGAFFSGFASSGFSVGGGQGIGGAIKMAIVGGTISEIGGGKFANGAMGSAFQYLYNDSILNVGKSISKLWSKKGEIADDIVQGVKGGLQGYRDVRDNAPGPIKLWLQGTMTITEFGLGLGMANGVNQVYDFTSGMFFDTSPIASGAGLSGFYTRQYIDAFYGNENYELKNLLPVNY